MFYMFKLCYKGEFNEHQSMKLKLREISTIELFIVYLSCLETLEWLGKDHNGFLMMCGQSC